MPKVVRAQVRIPSDSGMQEDIVTNTLYFYSVAAGSVVDADTDAIHARLTTFYGVVDQFLSSMLGTAGEVRYYDMDDSEPRFPIAVEPLTITPAASSGVPREVACCLSFRGSLASGQQRRRRHGRIYIGPLASTALATGSFDMRMSGATRTTITTAAAAMGGDFAGAGANQWRWCVFSPTNASGGDAIDGVAGVVAGWMDDALDTQRRRGVDPSERTLFTVAGV